MTRGLLALLLGTAVVACGNDGVVGDPNVDDDGDGYTDNEGDCDDLNSTFYPGAPDPCDGKDQNCDGQADDLFDGDGDGYTTCAGDCRDNDPTSSPIASEVIDGFDNDCDGITDNHTDQYDDDGDGYSEDQGDCNDDENGNGPFIGPGAIEVQTNEDGSPEGLDNDCDGEVDEALLPCPDDTDPSTGLAYAHAVDVCDQVSNSGWDNTLNISAQSRNIVVKHGTYTPHAGPDMVVLSTGLAGDSDLPGWADPVFGTAFTNQVSHPSPQGDPQDGCGLADGATVEDYTELRLTLNAPSNATGFSFDFNFMSGEFPTFVCSLFDDTFLAILESQAYSGNISFDENGNRVSINIGFFDVCANALGPNCTGASELAGTGYESYGGTGWLTTTAPVVGGEKAILTFMIFDEGDDAYDSLVLIDNFRWQVADIEGPITEGRDPLAPSPFIFTDDRDKPVQENAP